MRKAGRRHGPGLVVMPPVPEPGASAPSGLPARRKSENERSRRRSLLSVLPVLFLLAFGTPARTAPFEDDSPVSSALTAVYRAWRGSVVQVIAYRMTGPLVGNAEGGMTPLEPPRATLWATGVVMDNEGQILTCAESAQPGDSLEIRLPDGTRVGARFLAQDVGLGLSLVRAQDASRLVPARRSVVTEPRGGEWMLVVSFPVGADRPDLRLGCLAEPVASAGNEARHLRVELADCHGACGGAVVDARGRFRGMLVDLRAEREEDLVAGRTPAALDPLECTWVRAITEAEVTRAFDRLQERSRSPVGFLGVRAERLDASRAGDGASAAQATAPLQVVWVLPGSPAAAAGIRAGDEILAVNDQPVRDADEITRAIAGTTPGTTVRVRILRSGAPLDVTARLIDRSALDWQEREEQLNLLRQKRVRMSIDQLQRRLKSLEQARVRLQ